MKDDQLCQMEFTTDENGNELLLKDGEFQVMMEWERPYMEAIIDAMQPQGDVLEIGFGCGYSASAIQKHPIKSHTIIEYHPKVIEKAELWRDGRNDIHLVHDTWQNGLKGLGVFDTIFFDDYPLETKSETIKAEKLRKKTIPVLDQGKKLVQRIEKKFAFIKEIKYQDSDLNAFFDGLKRASYNKPEHFVKFFEKLQKNGQITHDQLLHIHRRLIDEGLIKESDLTPPEAPKTPFEFRGTTDRFIKFLREALESHTRKGSVISCYIEDPKSKYENDEFVKHVLTNPYLDYKESWVPVAVPSNCRYYKGDKALIIRITKH